eukprot:Clim_evm34s99 gene=Clim_evmTU34s99
MHSRYLFLANLAVTAAVAQLQNAVGNFGVDFGIEDAIRKGIEQTVLDIISQINVTHVEMAVAEMDLPAIDMGVSSQNVQMAVNFDINQTNMDVALSADKQNFDINMNSNTVPFNVTLKVDKAPMNVNLNSKSTPMNLTMDTQTTSMDIDMQSGSMPMDLTMTGKKFPMAIHLDSPKTPVEVHLEKVELGPVSVAGLIILALMQVVCVAIMITQWLQLSRLTRSVQSFRIRPGTLDDEDNGVEPTESHSLLERLTGKDKGGFCANCGCTLKQSQKFCAECGSACIRYFVASQVDVASHFSPSSDHHNSSNSHTTGSNLHSNVNHDRSPALPLENTRQRRNSGRSATQGGAGSYHRLRGADSLEEQ